MTTPTSKAQWNNPLHFNDIDEVPLEPKTRNLQTIFCLTPSKTISALSLLSFAGLQGSTTNKKSCRVLRRHSRAAHTQILMKGFVQGKKESSTPVLSADGKKSRERHIRRWLGVSNAVSSAPQGTHLHPPPAGAACTFPWELHPCLWEKKHVSCHLIHSLRVKYLAQPLPYFKLRIWAGRNRGGT